MLLHGLGANSNSWLFQTRPLQQSGFRTIAPDAPGFGKSRLVGIRASIDQFCSPIETLVRQLGIASFHVVGISMGGAMALQIALDHPGWVSRLVLVNTFARLSVTDPRQLPYFAVRFILVHTLGLPTQARLVAKRIFPYPDQEIFRQGLIEQLSQADPQAYRAAMRALASFDVRSRLNKIECPTLVVTGDRDTTVPLEAQHYLAQHIPGAYQVIIKDAGHAVTIEKAEQFNQVLVEFLCSES